MLCYEMSIREVFIIKSEPITDECGYFARTFYVRECEAYRRETQGKRCNIFLNLGRRTLRNWHVQLLPHSETKRVRCVRGAIYDVMVDLRPASPTVLKWILVEMNARELRSLYNFADCAHGFQFLDYSTEVVYQMSEHYVSQAARGIRCNKPAIAVEWPMATMMIAARDRLYAFLNHRDAGKEFRE